MIVLIKLAIRLVVFGVVFFLAARKNPKVVIHNKWATPLIALVFALLNTGVYWLLTPILNLATLGAMGFIMPFVVNMVFLLGTVKVFEKLNEKRKSDKKWIEIQGLMATLWMAAFLTLAHGALYLGLDYFPNM
ncbi:MAG: phage holin family protein [Myxococcales bacterium]|nr:phage holin family protein [Myxococcales bacterium]